MTMPDGLKTVRIEVWPVAADEMGPWLLSGTEAWCPPMPVAADTTVHSEVELTLAQHGLTVSDLTMLELIHSTSWRDEGPHVTLTYMAVVSVDEFARRAWPDALPFSRKLADAVGKPDRHLPTAAPDPRLIDVVHHGLRHLALLLELDDDNAAALDENWRTHLADLRPALAGLYRTEQAA